MAKINPEVKSIPLKYGDTTVHLVAVPSGTQALNKPSGILFPGAFNVVEVDGVYEVQIPELTPDFFFSIVSEFEGKVGLPAVLVSQGTCINPFNQARILSTIDEFLQSGNEDTMFEALGDWAYDLVMLEGKTSTAFHYKASEDEDMGAPELIVGLKIAYQNPGLRSRGVGGTITQGVKLPGNLTFAPGGYLTDETAVVAKVTIRFVPETKA